MAGPVPTVSRWSSLARRAGGRWHVPPAVLLGLIEEESGGKEGLVSAAGARGLTQFMPGTARSYGVNVTPGHARSQIFGAAHYLHDLGFSRDPALALASYAAGPGNPGAGTWYAKNVRSLARSYRGAAPAAASGGGGASGAAGATGSAPDASARFDLGSQPQTALGLLQALQQTQERPTASLPARPAFAAGVALPQGAQLPSGGGGPTPAPDISGLLATIQTPGGDIPGGAAAAGGPTSGPAPQTPGAPARAPAGTGAFRITGQNPGRLQPVLVQFARRVAGVYGHPLTGDSGATHSKYTVNGNVSDHFTGNATDIPAAGKTLLRLGRAALIAAGMPRKQAMRQTGGLFNVNGHQVIFLTNQGGNHFDHLHISARR